MAKAPKKAKPAGCKNCNKASKIASQIAGRKRIRKSK